MIKIIFLLIVTFLTMMPTFSLRIHDSHFTQNLQQSIKHNLQSITSHSYSKRHDDQIPDSVFNDLKEFVADDVEITNRIHAEKPLSKVSSEKVKNYFLENEEFKQFTLRNLVQEGRDPKCLDDLSSKGFDKLFKIILDQVDFSTIFLPENRDQEFTQEQIVQIIFELKTDKELCPALQKCFSKTKN